MQCSPISGSGNGFTPLILFIAIISVNLPAVQDVWLIGDQFLHSTYHQYALMHKKAKMSSSGDVKPPYLTEHYNVTSHTMGDINGITIAMSRIQNCIMSQLNNCKTMPRFIIIVPDNDLLKSNQTTVDIFDYGARKVCDRIATWLALEINDAVLNGHKAMKQIRRGSVMAGDPKLIFVKMIYRPIKNDVQSLRNIFNDPLENALVSLHNNFVVRIQMQNNQFDHTKSCLTDRGTQQFWWCLDRQLEEFDNCNDKQKSALRPVKCEQQQKQSNPAEFEQFRLPPPPPNPRIRAHHNHDWHKKVKCHLDFSQH